MITLIPADDYDQHWRDVRAAVRDIFPMLSYPPQQTQAFLSRWRERGKEHSVFLVQTRSGHAFARRIAWDIQYLIPSDWDSRYEILRRALAQITADFRRAGAEKLSLGIDDGFPSHTLYFAGMLPTLGFEVHSGQITLQAEADLLSRLALPALPPGVRPVRVARERLPEYAALYAQAHAAREHRPATRDEQRKWLDTLTEAATQEDLRKTWVGLERGGQIVASCYGGCRPERWGNFLSVEELAVLPAFFGQGLGRHALIDCLRELQRHYGAPGRPFQVGTWRHMGPRPLRLYLGLGFRVTQAETYASLWNRPQREG